MIRFRSFRAALLTLILGVVAVAQVTTFMIVAKVNRQQADREIAVDLRNAAAAFNRVTSSRSHLLASSAKAVASDFAFRRLFFDSADDPATLQSAFASASNRINADLNAWVDLDGVTIVASQPVDPDSFTDLVFRADGSQAAEADGYLEIQGQLFSAVVVPIRAPTIVGWWVVGFRIDNEFANELNAQTRVEVSFASRSQRIVASSLDADSRAELEASWLQMPQRKNQVYDVPLADDTYKVMQQANAIEGGGELSIILQFSLDEKLAPARRLARWILAVSLGGIGLAAGVGLGFARRLSRPVQQLARHTQLIASGDYTTKLNLRRQDELGDLANAFNHMSSGLAERDQVRDLLDKNVSPEVAAQLMQEGSALGGEERMVSVLFADLRGFTTMSEHMPPRDVVALLNRYLNHMAGVIEAEGGVIDKFIGDEIMALFGAPVRQSDCALRAVRAALGMRQALAKLNEELVAEGLPPLAFGIGINSARVVAGNIGSASRLNYSVIGDGVNLAARLQAQTRKPEFKTDLIVSEATLTAAGAKADILSRNLGTVTVKGRAQATQIYAVEGLKEL
jgi:adenylate cyclase